MGYARKSSIQKVNGFRETFPILDGEWVVTALNTHAHIFRLKDRCQLFPGLCNCMQGPSAEHEGTQTGRPRGGSLPRTPVTKPLLQKEDLLWSCQKEWACHDVTSLCQAPGSRKWLQKALLSGSLCDDKNFHLLPLHCTRWVPLATCGR